METRMRRNVKMRMGEKEEIRKRERVRVLDRYMGNIKRENSD